MSEVIVGILLLTIGYAIGYIIGWSFGYQSCMEDMKQ